MINERISYVDLGAGLMILWMIVFHAVSCATDMEITMFDLWKTTDASLIPEGVHAIIGSDGKIHGMGLKDFIPNMLFFFMPWFFYKSGQFFTKRSIADECKKDTHKLIREFVIWSAVGYVLYVFFHFQEGNITLRSMTYSVVRGFFLNGHIELNLPLWFLFTLFLVRQIANIILPHENDKHYWLKCISIIIVGYGIAFGAYCFNFRLLPLWVANGSAGLAYFTLGYCMSKYEDRSWILISSLLIYIACCIWGFPYVSMRSNSCSSSVIYLLSMPGCFAGIVVFNNMCRLITQFLRPISLPFEYVGKFAMIIYVSHCIIFSLVCNILYIWDLTSFMPYTFWIIIGSYILFLPLICYLSLKVHTRK